MLVARIFVFLLFVGCCFVANVSNAECTNGACKKISEECSHVVKDSSGGNIKYKSCADNVAAKLKPVPQVKDDGGCRYGANGVGADASNLSCEDVIQQKEKAAKAYNSNSSHNKPKASVEVLESDVGKKGMRAKGNPVAADVSGVPDHNWNFQD